MGDVPTYRDAVRGLHDEGKSYRQISRIMMERHGVDLSPNQIGTIVHTDYEKRPYKPQLKDDELWPAIYDTILSSFRLDPTLTSENVCDFLEELYDEKV